MFASFKAEQRELWAGFAVNEGLTTLAAAELVGFARVAAGEAVLDVACGTGVVAITAARRGAVVKGLDLTPGLLERARENAGIAEVATEFTLGDAESLPYADASFDVVLSQFGHIFAPRPEVVTGEMLRVLKPGGRIAFTTWPPEHMLGLVFALIERHGVPGAAGEEQAASVVEWGRPETIAARLGGRVRALRFGRGFMTVPALSARHVFKGLEANFPPLKALLGRLDVQDAATAGLVRAEMLAMVQDQVEGNLLRQHYLMAAGVKNQI